MIDIVARLNGKDKGRNQLDAEPDKTLRKNTECPTSAKQQTRRGEERCRTNDQSSQLCKLRQIIHRSNAPRIREVEGFQRCCEVEQGQPFRSTLRNVNEEKDREKGKEGEEEGKRMTEGGKGKERRREGREKKRQSHDTQSFEANWTYQERSIR